MIQYHAPKQFQSFKQNTYAQNGMVATSSPLAAQAGIQMLKQGGNAIDAAIATAITLTVVEPTSNGIGGDAFAIIYKDGELHGLNSSGDAPDAISIDAVKAKGFESLPSHGAVPVTVPGAPAAWIALSKRFGKLPFEKLFEPAIQHAESGFIVSDYVAHHWHIAYQNYKAMHVPGLEHWFDAFAPNGRAPSAGERWLQLDQAHTLREIADSQTASFYSGALASKIVDTLQHYDGFMTNDDLAQYLPEWVRPIRLNYRGYEICEIPPNGQGVTALMALNALRQFNLSSMPRELAMHRQIEAIKQAFVDVAATVADQRFNPFDLEYYLSSAYSELSASKQSETAQQPTHIPAPTGGTVYLCTADSEGNMVSFIQSNYMGFGSGIVVPGTGIALHNRGYNFSFDPKHPNALAGGKRPYHTIIPGFIMKDNEAIGPFGVMGGFMQPQGHLQVISNLIDFGMSPQDALDAPRWQWMKEKSVNVERSMPEYLIKALSQRAHDLSLPLDNATFGRGQMILRLPGGGYIGGTEMRCDGYIAVC
ncbi:MAG: gamma-glutamyltranspeptidase / glutathione hydrolase [Clostridiales bacterium]|nr:gamma-glutamyltranspeptidase / glutathione hydrolase [Clostridiales bacterium]